MAWTRNVLRINLTDGKISNEPLNMEWANDYLGINQSETTFGRGDPPEIAQAAQPQPAISFHEIRRFVLG